MSNKFTGHQNAQSRDYVEDRDTKSQDTIYATSNGAPHPHPYGTQRAGENGPLLLQDFHLIDLLSHFDRERVPERVVHAKGSGAHGYFECTNPIPELTIADLFSQKGKRCPLSIRFSTVGGESGSHDCARDPRGFAVKFRTVSNAILSKQKISSILTFTHRTRETGTLLATIPPCSS
ncbi:catalase A, variant 2 [Orbilia javanica]